MVTEKKTTKPKVKSSKKPKSKKLPKKTLKLVKSNPSPFPMGPFSPGFSFPEVEPPDGFRVVSTTQALMEYGVPLMEMIQAPNRDANNLTEVFRLVTEIWNYAIDDKVLLRVKKSKEEILSLFHNGLGVDMEEANHLLSVMLKRKQFLFPDEIQPKRTPFTFMRKEVSYLITKFDQDKLNLHPKVLPPNALDIKLVENLNKLDLYIKLSADYDKYEKLLLKVQDGFFERFNIWLAEKGVSELQEQFSFIAEVFVDFIYGYEHQQPLTLKDGPGKYLVEFMIDSLLHETSMEPWEYTLAPSALRLIYSFLHEKEYFREPPDSMFELLDTLEGHFIDYLKEQFS